MDAITQDPPPDIVLLDLSMPAPQGMEVLLRLKNMVVRPRPRVIVLTANGSVARAVEAIKLGAVDFLEKPCQPEQLLAVIHRALDQKVLAEAATPEGYAAALARARRYLADGHTARAEEFLRAASRMADHDPEYFYLLGLWHESMTVMRKPGRPTSKPRNLTISTVRHRKLCAAFPLGLEPPTNTHRPETSHGSDHDRNRNGP